VNKTSVELTAQDDDFWEAKRCKRHISSDTSQTVKNLTKPVPMSAAVKLPPKAVLTCNFFVPLTTIDMDTETTEADNALPEQEDPRKSGRPPPTVMTSTTNLIRLQKKLKRTRQRRVQGSKHTKWNPYHNKIKCGLFSH
jgi:hypothetical protein